MENFFKKEYKQDLWTKIMIYFLLFVIGGVIGFIYEEFFYKIDLGYWVKRGTTVGPWIPIYGWGSIAIAYLTQKFKKNPLVVFLLGTIISGIIEFGTGYVLFHFFDGLRLWDYNVEIWNWGNIGGYICARSVLLFGFAGLMLDYLVIPVVNWLSEKMNKKVFSGISIVLFTLFALDILLSTILHVI